MGRRTLLIIVAIQLTALIQAACAPASPPPTVEATEVGVQFSWSNSIEFVGFYEAERQSYYTEENLSVALNNGGYDAEGNYIDPVARVVDGDSDFGIAGADVILTARAAGQPLIGIATIYQRSPVALISLAEKDIVARRC